MMPTSLSDLLGNHPLASLIEKLMQAFHSDDDNVSHATDFVESLAKKALEVGESPGSVSVMALSGLASSMNMYRNLRTTTSKMVSAPQPASPPPSALKPQFPAPSSPSMSPITSSPSSLLALHEPCHRQPQSPPRPP